MTDAAVAGIEVRRVGSVQALHPAREGRLTALDDEVEVVSHQAVHVHSPAELTYEAAEIDEEEAPVVVVEEDEAPVDAARRQVPDAVRKAQPLRSGHAADRTCTEPAKSRPRRDVAQLLQTTRLRGRGRGGGGRGGSSGRGGGPSGGGSRSARRGGRRDRARAPVRSRRRGTSGARRPRASLSRRRRRCARLRRPA